MKKLLLLLTLIFLSATARPQASAYAKYVDGSAMTATFTKVPGGVKIKVGNLPAEIKVTPYTYIGVHKQLFGVSYAQPVSADGCNWSPWCYLPPNCLEWFCLVSVQPLPSTLELFVPYGAPFYPDGQTIDIFLKFSYGFTQTWNKFSFTPELLPFVSPCSAPVAAPVLAAPVKKK